MLQLLPSLVGDFNNLLEAVGANYWQRRVHLDNVSTNLIEVFMIVNITMAGVLFTIAAVLGIVGVTTVSNSVSRSEEEATGVNCLNAAILLALIGGAYLH